MIYTIPRRYFSKVIDLSERCEIVRRYESSDWDEAKTLYSKTDTITRSSVDIAKNMYGHLGIEVFPCAYSIALVPSIPEIEGCKFVMIGRNGKHYYFKHHSTRYGAKKGKYLMSNNVIYRVD